MNDRQPLIDAVRRLDVAATALAEAQREYALADAAMGYLLAQLAGKPMEPGVDLCSAMDVDTRARGILERAGIHTVDDLCTRTADEVRHLPKMGAQSFNEIMRWVLDHGREFKAGSMSLNSWKEIAEAADISQKALAWLRHRSKDTHESYFATADEARAWVDSLRPKP